MRINLNILYIFWVVCVKENYAEWGKFESSIIENKFVVRFDRDEIEI